MQVPATYDNITGRKWEELNSFIIQRFDEADAISGNTKIKEFIKEFVYNTDDNTGDKSLLLQVLEDFITAKGAIRIINIWGSSMEGGTFSSFHYNKRGKYIWDFDVMFNILPLKLSKNLQKKSFKYHPDQQGHLAIAIPKSEQRTINQMYLEKGCLSGYKVKQNFHLQKRSIWKDIVKIGTDSNPMDGKASISVNIEINATNVLAIIPSFRKLLDNILNLSPKEKEKKQLDKIWEEILTDNIFKIIPVHIDLIPAVECELWPSIAKEWIRRKRVWPPKAIIDQIVKNGFHVVPKSSPGGDPKFEWRLSFSKAELTLAENRTNVQKKCYYIFKSIVKENLYSDIISTYYLKTIMMWAVEQNTPEHWKEDNIGQAVLGLLDDLLHAVEQRFLAHYFIKGINLISRKPGISWQNVTSVISQLRKSFIDIDRQEKVLVSLKAKNTDYEPVLSVSRKRLKTYHALIMEHIFGIRVSCMQNSYEKCISESAFSESAFTPWEFECIVYPILDTLEEYLIGEYEKFSSIIRRYMTEVRKEIIVHIYTYNKKYEDTVNRKKEQVKSIEKLIFILKESKIQLKAMFIINENILPRIRKANENRNNDEHTINQLNTLHKECQKQLEVLRKHCLTLRDMIVNNDNPYGHIQELFESRSYKTATEESIKLLLNLSLKEIEDFCPGKEEKKLEGKRIWDMIKYHINMFHKAFATIENLLIRRTGL